MVFNLLFFELLFALVAVAFLAGWAWTWRLETVLRRKARFDLPNERSLHSIPTPRGGGIAVVGVVLLGYLLLDSVRSLPGWTGFWRTPHGLALLGFAGMAYLGHCDDRHPLSAGLRLSIQVILVGISIWLLRDALPYPADISSLFWESILLLAWVWMINLTNFMDGSDGISAVQTACIMVGVLGLSLLVPVGSIEIIILSALILGAVLGFLVLNWHPAKIFLGDVGSIPLGFIIFYLLANLARADLWLPAIILPLYYLADATITLVRRGLRGEKIWQAHRAHFYQQAVQAGRSHAQVARAVLLCNIALILCAWAAALKAGNHAAEAGAAAIAVVSVAILLYWLSRKPNPKRS